MGERSPSALSHGCYVKTSDLVQPIQNNHENKDFYLNLLIRRMDKAFEDLLPTSSSQQIECGFPRKIPNSSIMVEEWNNCKDNMTIKCILLVAIILDRFKVIVHFRKECWELLRAMYKLAKSFHRLKDFPILNQLHKEKNAEADPVPSTIVDASFACFIKSKEKKCDQLVLNPFKYKKDIEKYQTLVDEAHRDLGTQMLVYILRCEQRRLHHEDGGGTVEETAQQAEDEVNREGEVKQVLQFLKLGGMKEKLAVVIKGDSSQTKSNLADAVYDHLEVELFFRGWKLYHKKLIKNLEFNPNLEELHSGIVNELAGGTKKKKKHGGKQSQIKQNEPVFICIDNILRAQDLRKILDMKLMRRMKVRSLVTSPNMHLKTLLEGQEFVCEEHEVDAKGPSTENSQQINTDSETFSKDPLLLEMVEAYIKRCEGDDERGAGKLSEFVVKDDLVATAFNFALEMSYLNLPATAQDAFLDICSFFLGWDWDEISLIVGEAELETLEENSWVKKNVDNHITVPEVLPNLGRSQTESVRITNSNELDKTLSKADETIKKIKGIWLMDKEETPVEIPPAKLEHMRDSLRVLSLGRVTVVTEEFHESFQKLRFLQVGRSAEICSVNKKQMIKLSYFSSDEDLNLDLSQLPPRLKVLKLCGDATLEYDRGCDRKEWIAWDLQDLRTLKVQNFLKLGIPDPKIFRPFEKLKALSINTCSVVELPESLTEMCVLEKLDLHDCRYLRKLPQSFGTLLYLASLNLSYCSSLKRLPESFGHLQSLKELVLSYCSALRSLPSSFGWLSSLKKATFSNCKNIQKLPDKFELLSSLEEVDFSYCNNLKLLPTNFHLLSSLHLLNLQGCSKLEKLPDSFPQSLLKSKSVAVKLSGCSSLTDLQEEFCRDNKIEDLSLAYCTNLDKLPRQINELRQLRKLNLSYCQNLLKLPKQFNELTCLEVLNLSSCDKLRKLCEGFNGLKALKDLNLSKCSVLEGKWMRTLEKIQSLRVVDIRGCLQFKTKRRYHFTVLSGPSDPADLSGPSDPADLSGPPDPADLSGPSDPVDQNEDILQKILDSAASKFFKDKATLIDLDGRPFFPSKQISPQNTLAFIFDHNISRWDWEMLEKNVDELLANLMGMEVIYVGRSFSTIPTKLLAKIIAYTPENSEALSLFDRSLSISAGPDFWEFGTYIIKTKVAEEKGFKHFTEWESISGALMGRTFNIQNYRKLEETMALDSRQFLSTLLMKEKEELPMTKIKKEMTEENEDFEELCTITENNKEQVTINALKEGIVFLLISTLEISPTQITFLKEMYKEMQKTHQGFKVDWVWVPVAIADKDQFISKYKKLSERMPWVVISDPLMMEQSTVTIFFRQKMGFCQMPILVSWAPWGISTTDVIPMVVRLGSEAWLFLNNESFSDDDNKELVAMQELSHLHFLFRHVEDIERALNMCQMVWLYGGDPEKIQDFNRKLSSCVSELKDKDIVQILYVGRGRFLHDTNSIKEEESLHKKNTHHLPWQSLPFEELKRFWHHTHYLVYLIASQKSKRNIVSLQSLLLGLLSLDCLSRRNGTVWMMAIDESGNDILTGKGRELVETMANNIQKKMKSQVAIAKGAVEVLSSKTEGDEGPLIELVDQSGRSIEQRDKQTFVDALWLTAHPSSQLVEQISANNCCSMCYFGDPAYHCDLCGCFSVCQECYISEFIGRSQKERGAQITIEVTSTPQPSLNVTL